MSTDLAVIEAALKAATPGPWETWPHTHIEDDCRCLSCQFVTVWQTRNSLDCEDVPRKPGESERCEASGYSWEDANLIANAPTWLAELVERVRLLEGAIDGIRSSARTDRFACCACCLEAHDADSELVNNHILPCNICQDPWMARSEAAEAAIERVRRFANNAKRDYAHISGCGGDPECPACWAHDTLRTLDGDGSDEVTRFTSANSAAPAVAPTPPFCERCGGRSAEGV